MLRPQRVPGHPLWKSRQAKRVGRNRRRYCDKIGHGDWMFTAGFMTLNGEVVQSDQGRLCGRCGFYLFKEIPNLKLVQMTGVA